MGLKALIFDLDGTLVDTAPDLRAATNHVMALLKRRPLSMEEVRAFVGHGARALIARGCEATGDPVDPHDIEPLYQAFIDHYTANIAANSRPFPGLLNLLECCQKAGLAMGVCTNKLETLSTQLLAALDMSKYFSAIVGPDTIGVAKPDPQPYAETLRRMQRSGAHSLMFGDSETDVRTAQNANVPIIAVSFGYTTQHVSAFGPTHIIDHYDEAWPIIQSYL